MTAAVSSAGNRSPADHSVVAAVSDVAVPDSAGIRLARAEYWLLLRAATIRLPLRVIAAPEGPPWGGTIQEAFNCDGHGLPRDALARTLQRLVRRGWIRLYRWHLATAQREPLAASRRAIAAGFDRRFDEDGREFYELTPQGGAVFEAFARPDWDRYVEDGSPLDADEYLPDERRIVAADRRRLDNYLRALRQEREVVAGSEVFRERADWQPVYWKPPRAGVECRLLCRSRSPQEWVGSCTTLQQRYWCEWGG